MSDEVFRKLISEIEGLKRKIERLQVLENGGSGVTDHGALTGLADDDHTQYIKHSLATAVSDFLVASGTGAFVKKTLAEVKTVLGLGSAAYTDSSAYLGATAKAADSDKLDGNDSSAFAGVFHNHNFDYLGITNQAADSDKLDGEHATYFMPRSYKDGWIPVSDTWTYNAANKINVPSGAASIYSVGMGIRLTANSVVKQAYITKVENTLLTVAGDALTNYTFSAISYAPNPATAIGFPVWFVYSPTITWTAGTAPSGSPNGVAFFWITGNIAHLRMVKWGWTAGATVTGARVSLPFVISTQYQFAHGIVCVTDAVPLTPAYSTVDNNAVNIVCTSTPASFIGVSADYYF